uniref:Protein yippee-like n=1 Tax=Mucochytrium quahogii TaxID=96639 RepID=A0A7S2RCE9_9STRA|mmetsp:Transcript_8150/g.13148  ORF Transcript_8150/g.13148 Transcript_8150/m.13148 type:complete len:109 (-) Transcript_8150:92-418(-)
MSLVQLDGPRVYSCSKCRTHLAHYDDIMSKSFHGRNGRAYLVNHTVNVKLGPKEDRVLMTGLHTVCDVICRNCETVVGWKYEAAYNATQRYKVGKFIVEKAKLNREAW